MARNIEARILEGNDLLRENPRCDLSVTELMELMENQPSGIYDKERIFIGLSRAFSLGVSIGSRLVDCR